MRSLAESGRLQLALLSDARFLFTFIRLRLGLRHNTMPSCECPTQVDEEAYGMGTNLQHLRPRS